ncbi:reticulon-1-A-like isoform X2 [Ptychodera flava]|uniref:reticulon-1-A-like isoform X2 n=1 Tax=Ptychodera flava TaxID=63121 RepID=UPI00396A6345
MSGFDEFDPMSSSPRNDAAPFDNEFVQLDPEPPTVQADEIGSSGRGEAAEEDLYTANLADPEPSNLLNFEDDQPPPVTSSTDDDYRMEPESVSPDTNFQEPETEPEPAPEFVSKPSPTVEESPQLTQEPTSQPGGIFAGLQNLDPREMQEPIDDGNITEETKDAEEESRGDDAVTSCDSHHQVVELIYWRDPKKSGIVFGSVLFLLLSLCCNSLISVVAYLSLAVLTVTISFRVYKTVLQAVQKTGEGNPFKAFLDTDIEIPRDKVTAVVDHICEHANCTLNMLRRLFLVEDLVDSIKFAVMLWLLTYIGGWFNGLTLLILGFIGLFTLPKVYELHQEKIDNYIDLVNKQVKEVMTKIQAKVPWLKKKTA